MNKPMVEAGAAGGASLFPEISFERHLLKSQEEVKSREDALQVTIFTNALAAPSLALFS